MSDTRPSLQQPEGFHLPPDGDQESQRRAGFEIEYSGLELESAAQIVAAIHGGDIRVVSPFEVLVEDTPHGTFSIEVDAGILKDRSYRRVLDELGMGSLSDSDTERLETLLKRVSSMVVPFEIVTPPIPLGELAKLDVLRARLHENGAEGTHASWLNAFGLHINAEAPDMSAASVLAHLQAFILLYDWLCAQSPVDWSRRLGPYIEPFEVSFCAQVLQPDYAPSMTELIADYLAANATRNRALDLLPVLAQADEQAVAARVDGVSARPAYHYRLPNCRISDKDWRIAHEWNGWVWIERLAADPQGLGAAARMWLQAGGDVPMGDVEATLSDL